jgi:NADH dehydrogenase FAD-containing subunit
MHLCQPPLKVCTTKCIWNEVVLTLATVASQKAKYLASKLNKLARGKECSKPFVFHNLGSLAYVGNWFVSLIYKQK